MFKAKSLAFKFKTLWQAWVSPVQMNPLHDTADLCSAAYLLVAQDPLLKVSSAVAYQL